MQTTNNWKNYRVLTKIESILFELWWYLQSIEESNKQRWQLEDELWPIVWFLVKLVTLSVWAIPMWLWLYLGQEIESSEKQREIDKINSAFTRVIEDKKSCETNLNQIKKRLSSEVKIPNTWAMR